MYPVSSKWAPALSSAHGVVTRVDLLLAGSPVREEIPFTDGSVSVDAGSEVRRTLTLTIPDPTDFPVSEDDPFSPYGHELFVQSGLRYIDGSEETVPLGFFVIESIDGDTHTGPLTINAAGREVLIQAEPFETATSTAGYESPFLFIKDRILDVIPSATVVNEATAATTNLATATWDADSDRWAALQSVARSCGAVLFCNANGSFVLRDVPDPTTATPVWSVNAGDNGVMVGAKRSLSSEGVCNRVVVRGENAADNAVPISATATISDPSDPLRYGGPFGKRTKTITSDLATNSTKAQGMANAEIRKARQPNRTVSLSSVPNAALDADDCIRVVYGPIADPELHIVRSFSVPLTVGGDFPIETVGGKEDSE